ncbi:MAG: LURP-one-related family protein [Ruminococcus sp.]|nr:LURP-one-related family protein [Ruminococcus sp.]
MKLFIKRDKTVDGAMFAVLDELGKNKYYVKSAKSHIVLCDLKGKTLLKIKRILLPALRTYTLVSCERTIRFLINPKKSYCWFYGMSWHIRGDFFAKSFDIMEADNSVAATFARRFNDDGYELIVNCEHNELLCIGVAVCACLEAKVDNHVLQTV